MSSGALAALIVAITGLLATIPAIVLAFKGKSTADETKGIVNDHIANHSAGTGTGTVNIPPVSNPLSRG